MSEKSSNCCNTFGFYLCRCLSTDRTRFLFTAVCCSLTILFSIFIFAFATSADDHHSALTTFQATDPGSGFEWNFSLHLTKVRICLNNDIEACGSNSISSWETGTYECAATGTGLIANYSFLLLFSLISLILILLRNFTTVDLKLPRFFSIVSMIFCLILSIIPIATWINNCQLPLTKNDFLIRWGDGRTSSPTNVSAGGGMGIAVSAMISALIALIFECWRSLKPEESSGTEYSAPLVKDSTPSSYDSSSQTNEFAE